LYQHHDEGNIMKTCYNCDEALTGPVKTIGDYVWDEVDGEVHEEFLVHVTCPA
jgi:hypothetical protein